MMMQLAEISAGSGISPEAVGIIIASVITALLGGGYLGKKSGKSEGKAEGKAEAMQVGPQPFIVQLREEFATRRELDKLETTILSSAVKTEAAFEKFAELTAKQNDNLSKRLVSQSDRLSKQINEVGSGAYQGRNRIHVTQNEHTAQIAALQANIDMAKAIDRLADAIKPPMHAQLTQSSNS